ncbi:MAG: transposase, partial [Candidatus Desulfofervidus sp.]|nr:transposase [Candidatus Desulfofervidus sp.]
LDLNWFRKKITKADLEGKEFKWGYSSSKGYYIGYKLTLVIEYPSLRPVAFLLHQGSPSDAKIYEEILEELKRRRIARDGDTIIFDKGYYGYKNYAMGISRFKVISVIFPRKNFKMEKLMAMLSYPLSIFNRSNPEKEKEFYRGLVKSLARNVFSLLTQRRNYRRLLNGSLWRGLKN